MRRTTRGGPSVDELLEGWDENSHPAAEPIDFNPLSSRLSQEETVIKEEKLGKATDGDLMGSVPNLFASLLLGEERAINGLKMFVGSIKAPSGNYEHKRELQKALVQGFAKVLADNVEKY